MAGGKDKKENGHNIRSTHGSFSHAGIFRLKGKKISAEVGQINQQTHTIQAYIV